MSVPINTDKKELNSPATTLALNCYFRNKEIERLDGMNHKVTRDITAHFERTSGLYIGRKQRP